MVGGKLLYYATVTREPYARQGRVTDLLAPAKLFEDLGSWALKPATDRAMICGNPHMTLELRRMLSEKGLIEGNNVSRLIS